MHFTPIMPMVLAGLVVGAPLASAEILNTHRIPALLALEAASESVGVCAKALEPERKRQSRRGIPKHQTGMMHEVRGMARAQIVHITAATNEVGARNVLRSIACILSIRRLDLRERVPTVNNGLPHEDA